MSTSTRHPLPEPRLTGDVSVEQALSERRSLRRFAAAPVRLAEVSQLLWSAQGITDKEGGRTAPSAGATHPLEIFLVAGAVTGLDAGIYRYLPQRHELVRTAVGDRRAELAAAAYQDWVRTAPAAIVIAAVEKRTARYGRRASLYVHMEAGAVTENVHLQAEALGLGTTVVGAFDDRDLKAAVGLEAQEEPLAILPVGRRSLPTP